MWIFKSIFGGPKEVHKRGFLEFHRGLKTWIFLNYFESQKEI